MNLLLFDVRTIYPVLTGHELRVYHLFKALSKRHNICLVCTDTQQPSPEVRKHLEEIFVTVDIVVNDHAPPGHKGRSFFRRVQDLMHPPWDHFLEIDYTPELKRVIESRVREHNVDAVYAYGWSTSKFLAGVAPVPVINGVIDNPSVLYWRNAKAMEGFREKLHGYKDWYGVRNFVKQEMGQFKEVVLVSGQDAEDYRRLCPNTTVTVIPNGVDSSHFLTKADTDPKEPIMIFTGVMDYPPNSLAMLYFCKSVLPLVRQEMPEAQLMIVGRSPADSIKALHDPERGVTVTGEVEDIREYFEKAAVYVCSLRSGAGIKNKILEAWSMQRAVVATTVSCEGIDVKHGENVLVADTAEDFAQRTLEVLRDEKLRTKIALAGRQKVENDYTWDAQAVKVEKVLDRAIKNRFKDS